MKISYNWLKNYIDIDLDAQQVADWLTSTGLEVEGVEKVQSIPGGLEGIIIGEVVSCEKHQNADKLKVTQVDLGNGETKQIVCGAPNVDKGQKVVVATVGSTIYPTGGDPFEIKKAKIRGERSEGMICAEDELGIGVSHDGIMVLTDNPKTGTPAAEYFKVENDHVFEIGLTPNRADAASHIGTARDLVALGAVKDELKDKSINWPKVDTFKVDNHDLEIAIDVQNTKACPRYAGVTLTNVKVGPSPDWLQNKLRSIGLAPINNVVDITNFVLHETGQPLHAFDASKIIGNKVTVRTVADKTKFTTLDEEERELSAKDLMICNDDKPMCIAGVFGGVDSGVKEETVNVFLESAYFDPVWVRKTAKRHGLSTDASFRFERGVDPLNTIYALKRAAILMKELCGASISSEIVEEYPQKHDSFEITFNMDNLDRIGGKSLDIELVKAILTKLEIVIDEENGRELKLLVPPFKVDVQREIDVIEEVLRIYGYDNIEIPQKLSSSLSYAPKPNPEVIRNRASELLVSRGFLEAMSNSLTKADYYEMFKSIDSKGIVKIANPLSSELNVLRTSIVFDLLEAAQFNQNRQSTDIKLFEFGRTYSVKNDKSKECEKLAIAVAGNQEPEAWNTQSKKVGFDFIKGAVSALIDAFGLDKFNVQWKESEAGFLSSGLSITINKNHVADLGIISGDLLKEFSLKQDLYFAEIDWTNFMKLAGQAKVGFKPVSKYPSMRRDLALIVDKEVPFSSIVEVAEKTEKKLLENVNLFDVYEGKKIEDGKKSYAVSFIFRDEQKTLTDKKVDKVMSKLLQNLEKETGAGLRE